MTTKYGQFQRLSGPERRLVVQAFLLLPLVALGIRLLPVRRWHSVLTCLAPTAQEPAGTPIETVVQQARATARLIRVAAGHGLCRAQCLEQSLALWWLLRRQGLATDLRIGVRKEAGRFEAHAWVEHQGVVLNDRHDIPQCFAPFDRALLSGKGRSA